MATTAAAVSLISIGCGKPSGGGPPGGGPGGIAVQVVVAEAKVQPVTERLSLVGTLIPNEAIEIKSEIDGTLEEILFQEGQPVKPRDLLIRLDESKLKASLAEAEATFTLSQANLERLKTLQKSGSASQQEYDQAVSSFELNRASVDLKKGLLKDARILAPFAGVMGPRSVSPGQVIGKSALLGSLVAIDPVKVEFHVPERFLSLARVGQTIEITVAAWPDEKFQGEVYFIGPQLDEATRTALVKARLPNREGKLKPGMFADLDLTLRVRENAVVIPERALVLQQFRALVYVVGTNGLAEPRTVQTGYRMPGQVEITQGLAGGEPVIIEGTQKVFPGVKTRTGGGATPPATGGLAAKDSPTNGAAAPHGKAAN